MSQSGYNSYPVDPEDVAKFCWRTEMTYNRVRRDCDGRTIFLNGFLDYSVCTRCKRPTRFKGEANE